MKISDANKHRSPNRMRILVVDDDVDTLRLIRIGLMRSGFQVSTARDGVEALKHLGRRKPDIIILDVIMPQLGGLDLLKRLKSQPDTDDIPVILLTKKKKYEDIRNGYNIGADYYVTKPFKLSQIMEGINIVSNK